MLDWEELPNKRFPIIFHPVYGKDEREANSPSFFNVPEVETIERYLRKLLDDNERSKGLKHLRPEMIGVISPYKRQVGQHAVRLKNKMYHDFQILLLYFEPPQSPVIVVILFLSKQ